MLYDHAHAMQVKLCKANTRGVTTPFQEGEDHENISTIHASSSVNHSQSNIKDTYQGPFPQTHAKKLQEQVNSFLTNFNFNTSKNVILPKCTTLIVLRYIQKEEAESDHEDRTATVKKRTSTKKSS